MMQKIGFFLVLSVLIVLSFSSQALARDMSRTENLTVPSSGIKTICFKNIIFADLTYNGSPETDTFTIRFERIVKTDKTEEFEEMISRLDLDVITSGDKVIIELIHPKATSSGFFNRIFDRKEWRVKIDISGPIAIDCDIDTEFSDVRTISTAGVMKVNSTFSDTIVRNHSGKLDAHAQFCSFRCEELDGSFNVDSGFSDINLRLVNLAGNSRVSSSFGRVNLSLPRNTGADFNVNKSMGSANFRTSGSLTFEDHNGSRRVLNGGGPLVDLNVEFGDITVRDDGEGERTGVQSQRTVRSYGKFPLVPGAWWRYESDCKTLTLRVEKSWRESGREVATLKFSDSSSSPFESIDICETDEGICVTGIHGRFFSWNLSGEHRYNPPELWLPFSENTTVEGGEPLGTVRSRALPGTVETPAGQMTDVLLFTVEHKNLPSHEIRFAPGVGFITFGDLRLTAYDSGVKIAEEVKSTSPVPQFKEGIVKTIKIRGTDLLSPSDILNFLEINEGGTYTREEISEAIQKLKGKHKFIEYATFDIDSEGNLSVRVYEVKPHKKDFGIDASFNRIGGVGLGPKLKFTSLVGPISELTGSAQYHWANSEWTYRVRAEKSFFTKNRIAVGGTYRLDYESNLDWAIPPRDDHLNSFLVGLETKNYYQVEGATGYITFSKGNTASVKAEYFEDDFGSVKKHTNWSFFNQSHTKEDNPPLAPLDEGCLVGLRGTINLFHRTSLMSSGIIIEAEHALDKGNTIGEYTRLFGNVMNTWRMSSDNLMKIRLAGGYSNDILPGQKSFRLGGLNTLRGFGFDSIPDRYPFNFQYGGNRMLLCNIEYMLGNKDDMGFVFFGDAGGVWMKNQDFDIADIKRDIGIGLVFTFDNDFFTLDNNIGRNEKDLADGLRINWAVPVGNEPHVSHWTVNFVQAF